ncbi:zinc finger protein ZFP2-like [Uranotaenia lowii]|uniref:zinc finger protein ZFP2-like n=1 Tax=Uranotaenia lowii TaxID=190385 RepID=UPI0024785310|nr:zinc finger protein ZFP2-like [Uranotaenia lowii]
MESCCRLCFKQSSEMERIFPDCEDEDDVDVESQVAIKIFKCTSMQLPVDDDDLFSRVCKPCLAKLDEFFQFRVTCRKNNVLYRKKSKKAIRDSKAGVAKSEINKPIDPDDDLSLDKLDETLLRALEGKDGSMDTSSFDQAFASEIKPEELLTINLDCDDEQRMNTQEPVSSSSSRCNNCGGEFGSSFELNQHMLYCQQRSRENLYNLQIANISAGADLQCYMCNKSFSNMQDLRYHESLHSNSSMKCTFCTQTFTCSRTLRFHMDEHKIKCTLPNGRFKCDMCEGTFKLYGNMIIHRRSHTGERPYPCTICGRAFSTSSNMKTHMNVVHAQDRPYKCQQCHKSFNSETRLRSHMESHAFPMSSTSGGPSSLDKLGISELSSTCKICNKTFSHPSYLTIHYRVHTGERPYQCKFCTSAFATSGNLKVHMRIHAAQKIRPFQCNMCPKSFLHASNLSVHKKTHHY